LVSACATRPQITSQQESSQYRFRAGRNYTPPGPPSDPWGPYISEAAAKFDVPDRWVREVMHQESGGKLYHGGSLVTSGAGAMGLMQVMPATYDEIRARYPELGDDPYDPHNNILAGTAYIREMYDIYGSPGFLAAYNAGPGRLDDYLTRNRALPEETRRYVAAIGPRIAGAEPRTPSPGQQFAMNATPFNIPAGPRYASASRYSAPIVLSPAPTFTQPAFTQPVAPIQLAAAAPAGASPYIVLRPQRVQSTPLAAPAPIEVAEAEALPTPIIVPTPDANYRDPGQFAQVPEPPRYEPAPTSVQVAQLPEPPRPTPFAYREPPRSQQQMASASLVPVAPRGSGFSLISPANAEPIGMHRGGSLTGNWAVQVGAFANEGLASSAAFTARDHARDVLASARSSVTPVRQPHGILYRARLTGLSRDAASQACERLARSRTTCMVVSPDAQS
jgi:hypothetical protein